MKQRIPATLALADGTVFHGYSIGAQGETSGEVVFNTAMTGYQEILTDPSYAYQMITFTYPHIGNVGVNSEDVESGKVHVSGIIVRHLSEHYSNYRAEMSLQQYLEENNVVGISGIDTRALVLHLRSAGAQMGIIASGECDSAELVLKAKALESMEGMDLVSKVTCKSAYDWNQGPWIYGQGYTEYSEQEMSSWPLVVALDFGIKYNILRSLVGQGFRVRVVPAKTSAAEILALKPDAVFLSNGPGDPAAVGYAIKTVGELIGEKPMFGICLGHQILGIAMGAPTFKLKFGHRGGNHPVRDERTGKVEITVQNHGFATKADTVPKGVTVSHINLNDQTIEGFEIPESKVFSVQHHPESSPGPNDSNYLFKQFREMVNVTTHVTGK